MTAPAFPNPEGAFANALAGQMLRAEDAGRPGLAAARYGVPVEVGNGLAEVVFDLAAAALAGVGFPIDMNGFEVVFARGGSTPGAALALDFGGGQVIRAARPGEIYTGLFKRLTVTLAAGSIVNVGTARLILKKNPEVSFREEPQTNVAGGVPTVVGGTQVAAETNVPTLATQGVSIDGVSGGRVYVEADATRTVTGGTVRYWIYNLATGLWALSGFEIAVPTGHRTVVLPDATFSVPRGRWYAEANGVTVSAGSVTVRQEVWGF